MVKYIIILAFVLTSCQKSDKEDALLLSREYCSCIDNLSKKDTIIDAQQCASRIFSKSRLLNIRFSENKDNYPSSTIDSAEKFFLEVRKIIDTMCVNKYPNRRFKINQIVW
jgi:hypothetical protein